VVRYLLLGLVAELCGFSTLFADNSNKSEAPNLSPTLILGVWEADNDNREVVPSCKCGCAIRSDIPY
jgi:hypothetical protein